MKKERIWLILLGLLVLFAAVSCKSTPPQAEPVPPTAAEPDLENSPPNQAAMNELNAAADRAAAARKLVMDFDGVDLFPPDWQAADSLYSQAEQQKRTFTLRETRDSTARYNRAADALEALADKTLAQNYEIGVANLTEARNNAVNAGAGVLIPDFLLEADNTTDQADRKYKTKDFYGAKETAYQAYGMYNAMKSGLDAYKVREEIASRGFEVYDPLNVDAADNAMWSAASDYTDRKISSAQEKTEEAFLRYNIALKTGWQSYAAEKGADASTERQRALDYKANVAVRQEFNAAQAVYTRAESDFQGQRYEEAANQYMESRSMFEVIAQVAMEKQMAAQQALDRANQKIAESDETAKNAEIFLEGGAR